MYSHYFFPVDSLAMIKLSWDDSLKQLFTVRILFNAGKDNSRLEDRANGSVLEGKGTAYKKLFLETLCPLTRHLNFSCISGAIQK